MRAHQYWLSGRSIAALILLGAIAFAASGCYDGGGGYYGEGYPGYGYAPYRYDGWGGYNPVFVTHHPWEDHYGGGGHHTEFYHGGGAVAHVSGGGFHGGGSGGHGGGGGHR